MALIPQVQAQQQLVLKYEVEQIAETNIKYRLGKKVPRNPDDPKAGNVIQWEDKEEVVKNGYMVYYPGGHSLFVRDAAELRRMGLANPASLINDEGDEVQTQGPVSPKEIVRRATQQNRR